MGRSGNRVGMLAVLALAVPSTLAAASADTAHECDGEAATIVGTAHADGLVGTSGPEVIVGLDGDDEIDGRGGDDLVCGDTGRDVLRGGAGNDRLYGGLDGLAYKNGTEAYTLGDTLYGGPGDDLFDGGVDTRGIPATPDAIRYDTATHGVDVDLTALTGRGQGSDRFTAQRWALTGSRYDDTLSGSSLDDRIVGGPGDDTLSGRGGHDILEPDRDYDGDYYTQRSAGDDVVYGGQGDDTIDSYGGADRDYGGPGSDTVTDEGVHGADRLFGGPGPDFLNDVLVDAAGQRITGGAGRDMAYLGVHKLRAGKPVPTAVTLDLRTGSGSLRWGSQRRAFTAAWIEDLSAGDLPIGVTGAGGPWTVYGTDGANKLIITAAGRGPATLHGRGGDDYLEGTALNDRLYGGAGNDYAYPGRGRDLCVDVESISSFAGGCEQVR